jgi:hypothetical protein
VDLEPQILFVSSYRSRFLSFVIRFQGLLPFPFYPLDSIRDLSILSDLALISLEINTRFPWDACAGQDLNLE